MNTKNLLSILAVVVVGLAGGAYAISSTGKSQEAAIAQVPVTPTTETTPTTQTDSIITTTTTTTTTTSTPTASAYKDGTYTATGSYRAPSGAESVNVSLTLKNGVIVDSSVVGTGKNPETKEKQAEFIGGYKQYVTGKNINEVNLTVVSGSSLTSKGFNAAVESIKTQAKA